MNPAALYQGMTPEPAAPAPPAPRAAPAAKAAAFEPLMGRAEHEGRDQDDKLELTEHERQAERIYGERPNPARDAIERDIAASVPAEIRSLREARAREPANALFGETALGDEIVEATLNDVNYAPEVRRAYADEYKRLASDNGMTANEALEAASIINAPIADERTQSRWGRQTEESLKMQYGDEWQSRLADAKRLVNRDPRVAKIIESRGLGNNPKIVSLLCDLARRERLKGRL